MSNKADFYADLYAATGEATIAAAGNVPEDKRLHQLQGDKGHPLWLVGHLANALNGVVNVWTLAGDNLLDPQFAGTKFLPGMAGGDPITSDAASYPSWDDTVAAYKTASAAVVENIRGLSDADFDGDLKGEVPEQFKSFFSGLEKTLRSMAMHDGHHRGQICLLGSLTG